MTEKQLNQSNEIVRKPLLEKLFFYNDIIGVVGGRNSGKSSLTLTLLLEYKKKFKQKDVYVLGCEENIQSFLIKNGIKIATKTDILEERLRNCVLFIDEVGNLFNLNGGRQQKKFNKFIARVSHSKINLLLSSAMVNFWNKQINSLTETYLIKTIRFSQLVNGTELKNAVKGLEQYSEIKLNLPINEFFVLCDDKPLKKLAFNYIKEIDSKNLS